MAILKDNAELILGFLFGLLGNIWVTDMLQFPRSKVLGLLSWIIYPVRTVRCAFYPSFWRSRAVIKKVFKAWDEDDYVLYLSQWNIDAIQVEGSDTEKVRHLPEILKNFRTKMHRYSRKQTTMVIVTEFERVNAHETILYVFYQTKLVRRIDKMPLVEEANEVYRLSEREGKWSITHNYDHFKGVTK